MLPKDAFAAENAAPGECDRCGLYAGSGGLFYCEWTGEALCEACDIFRDEEYARMHKQPEDVEGADALLGETRSRVADLENQLRETQDMLKFANDTSEMLLEQLTAMNERLAHAMRIIEAK